MVAVNLLRSPALTRQFCTPNAPWTKSQGCAILYGRQFSRAGGATCHRPPFPPNWCVGCASTDHRRSQTTVTLNCPVSSCAPALLASTPGASSCRTGGGSRWDGSTKSRCQTLEQAAQTRRAEAALGHVIPRRRATSDVTLRVFLDETYEPWMKATYRGKRDRSRVSVGHSAIFSTSHCRN